MRLAYRPDIDGLRALAVLLVIGFHYAPKFFNGGFVGVDIFFVISGFLISSIIYDEVLNKKFSFVNFYSRRVRRIFPALLLVLISTLIAGWFVLLSKEYKDLGSHIVGGIGFLSNIQLWNDVNYFDVSAEKKPLLHLWSLGIEEQFYIFWPVLLVLGFRYKLNIYATCLIIAIISFSFNFHFHYNDPNAAFYSPLSRAWELMIGASLAISRVSSLNSTKPSVAKVNLRNSRFWLLDQSILNDVLSITGLVLILSGAYLVSKHHNHQFYSSIFATTGTAFIIMAGQNGLVNRLFLSSYFVVSLGLISYPLYLWHWPILVYLKFIFGDELSLPLLFLAFSGSLFLAWITYSKIEKPIKLNKFSVDRTLIVKKLIIGGALLSTVSALVFFNNGFPSRYNEIEVYNGNLGEVSSELSTSYCKEIYKEIYKGKFILERDFCLTNQNSEKDVLIIGDSHAGKLYDGFQDGGFSNITLLGRGSCAPLGNIESSAEWLKCQPLVNDLLQYAIKSPFKLIILTGTFNRYFDNTYRLKYDVTERNSRLKSFIQQLGHSKKEIVIVLDNPELPFNSDECAKSPFNLKFVRNCSFIREKYDRSTLEYRSLINNLAAPYSNIKIIDQSDIFCDELRCYATNEEGLTYAGDNNHLNIRGAKLVNKKIMEIYPNLFHTH
jgi:peptidoglycan/LPS O-acetylase OafA/YrhL